MILIDRNGRNFTSMVKKRHERFSNNNNNNTTIKDDDINNSQRRSNNKKSSKEKKKKESHDDDYYTQMVALFNICEDYLASEEDSYDGEEKKNSNDMVVDKPIEVVVETEVIICNAQKQ